MLSWAWAVVWGGVWWQLKTGRRKCEESTAVFWLLEGAMFCVDPHFPILFLPPHHWGEFCFCTSAHYSDSKHYCLCHTRTYLLSLDSAGIWPRELQLAVQKSLGDSKHKPCCNKQELTLFLSLILGLIDWPRTTEPTDPEKLLLIWRSMAGCIYYQDNPCSS